MKTLRTIKNIDVVSTEQCNKNITSNNVNEIGKPIINKNNSTNKKYFTVMQLI